MMPEAANVGKYIKSHEQLRELPAAIISGAESPMLDGPGL
jgi:hypothetical protein